MTLSVIDLMERPLLYLKKNVSTQLLSEELGVTSTNVSDALYSITMESTAAMTFSQKGSRTYTLGKDLGSSMEEHHEGPQIPPRKHSGLTVQARPGGRSPAPNSAGRIGDCRQVNLFIPDDCVREQVIVSRNPELLRGRGAP